MRKQEVFLEKLESVKGSPSTQRKRSATDLLQDLADLDF